MVWLMAACVVVAVGIWRTRPADRAVSIILYVVVTLGN